MSRIIVLVVLIIFANSMALCAQEVPGIIAFEAKDYNGAFQNWDIDQDCNGLTYIANSSGVLIFNGMSWQLLKLPNNKRPRTVFVSPDCVVYIGGYETFGYIDNTKRDQPLFVSLSDSVLIDSQQEIWAMYNNQEQIVFQSFANVYTYDHQRVNSYLPPENVMLGNTVNGEIIIPKITGASLLFKNGQFTDLEITKNLGNNTKTAAIVAGPNPGSILFATQFKGLFLLDSIGFNPVLTTAISSLKEFQINRVLRLKSGAYAIGTILNGIYILDDKFDLIHHVNKSKGLSNNTILSLFESKKGDLWVGMDKGINVIKLSDLNRYYYDKQGKLGTVFASIYHNGKMYIGTNQGVFLKNSMGSFELVKNSQGQVWSFAEIKNKLICGHNNGVFEILNEELIPISVESGVLCFSKVDSSKLMMSTYNGLYLLEFSNEMFNLKKVIRGDYLIENFILNDHQLIGYHNYYGIYDIRLSTDYSKALTSRIINKIDNDDIGKVSLVKHKNQVFFYANKSLYNYLDGETTVVDSMYCKELLIYSDFSEVKARMVYETEANSEFNYTVIVNDSFKQIMVGFDDGYKLIRNEKEEEDSLSIDYMTINGSLYNMDSNTQSFEPEENNILVFLKRRQISKNSSIQFRLLPWDTEWHQLPINGKLNFLNLKEGKYKLWLKYSDGKEAKLLDWTIKPYWYQSWKGLLFYTIICIILALIIDKRSKLKMEKEFRRLEQEREKEAEEQELIVRTESLERDLMHKSKLLANRTMTLVQKNKMLSDLKQLIDRSDDKQAIEKVSKQKIVHLIENNINSDQDWEIFERNFAEVHQDFLTRLKAQFTDITSGELRLAAYIKMNLSSKEIAPLLNISIRSVENKRYRLRKKLNVPSEVSLSEYIFKI